MSALEMLRRVMFAEVSVAGLIETALWLSLPYLFAGVTFAFVAPEHVASLEERLATALPAGADVAAFGQTVALWPMLLFTDQICAV